MSVPLVIAEPTGRCRRDLRRFTFSDAAAVPCPGWRGHDATTIVGEVAEVAEADANRTHGDNWPHDDPAWPGACEYCGYEFRPDDEWQRNDNLLFRLPDGTEFTTWGRPMDAPPGAMVRAHWYDEYSRHPDGIDSWLIVLPDSGTWVTSSQSTDGRWWTVTGIAPDLTASPSVWHNAPHGWHGWIRDGALHDA